jgi:hypothetical protein
MPQQDYQDYSDNIPDWCLGKWPIVRGEHIRKMLLDIRRWLLGVWRRLYRYRKPIAVVALAFGTYFGTKVLYESIHKSAQVSPVPLPEIDPYDIIPISADKRAIVVRAEKELVDYRFTNSDSIYLKTDSGTIKVDRKDIYPSLDEYTADQLSTINNSQGRDGILSYVQSSKPFLQKIISAYSLDVWSKEQRIRKILFFVQTKLTHMDYKHDLNPADFKDTLDYVRKPAISILNGLYDIWRDHGFQWDCDDFVMNFFALAYFAGIPEEDLCIIIMPGHVYIGIRNFDLTQVDKTYIYYDEEGRSIVPIEVTTNAIPHVSISTFFRRDTSYERRPTIGDGKWEEVTIYDKAHKSGFKTVRKTFLRQGDGPRYDAGGK